jgi:23S rRNA pseudouridine1911/1915/1917 synthase
VPRFVATAAEGLAVFLQRSLPAWAPNRLAALVREGHVSVNGKRANAGRKLWAKEAVDVSLPTPLPVSLAAGSPIAVLFEASGVLVVDKPADVAVDDEPPGPRERPPRGTTMVTRLAGPRCAVGGYAAPGVVHRLDAGTTGCLALATTDEGLARLAAAFETGGVTKQYLGWVMGTPPASGELDTPYSRDPANARRYTTTIGSPRRARLRFQTVQAGATQSLVSIDLQTGRTHQIRCQLAAIGHPLVGDVLYGAPPGPAMRLHAQRLAIEGLFDVTAPTPSQWADLAR